MVITPLPFWLTASTVDTGVAKSFTFKRRVKCAGILLPRVRTMTLVPCCCTSTGVLLPARSITTWPSPWEPRWKLILLIPWATFCCSITGCTVASELAELILRIKVLPSVRVVNAPALARFTVKRARSASELTSTELASAVATGIWACLRFCWA